MNRSPGTLEAKWRSVGGGALEPFNFPSVLCSRIFPRKKEDRGKKWPPVVNLSFRDFFQTVPFFAHLLFRRGAPLICTISCIAFFFFLNHYLAQGSLCVTVVPGGSKLYYTISVTDAADAVFGRSVKRKVKCGELKNYAAPEEILRS